MIADYNDSVQRYEAVFTKQFEERGFKWDVYVKTDDLKISLTIRCWSARPSCCGRKVPAVQAPQLYAHAGSLLERYGR